MATDSKRLTPLARPRLSMRDHVFAYLRDAVIRGQLPPGDVLGEEQLAGELQVSRTPLREALQRLQANGLIERAGNGRIQVRRVTVDEAGHLYAVRGALEELAIREAIPVITGEDLARLSRALEHMRADSRLPDRDVADSGGDFHSIVQQIAGNPIRLMVFQQIQALIDRYRHLSATATAVRRAEALNEHVAIYEALVARDEDTAVQATRIHITHSFESVRDALARSSLPASAANHAGGQSHANGR